MLTTSSTSRKSIGTRLFLILHRYFHLAARHWKLSKHQPADAIMFFAMLFLSFLLCCPFAGATTCTSLPEKVKEVCHFYNSRTSDAHHLKHIQEINRNTVIFHFTPLFSSRCWPLTQLLFCSILFPFCSLLPGFVLLPFRNICLSVHDACHPLFAAHYQEWPEYLNCSSLPLQPVYVCRHLPLHRLHCRLSPLRHHHFLPLCCNHLLTQVHVQVQVQLQVQCQD